MIKDCVGHFRRGRMLLSFPAIVRLAWRMRLWNASVRDGLDSVPGARIELEEIEEYVAFPPDVYKAVRSLREKFKAHPPMLALYMKAHKFLRLAHGLDRENDAKK